MPVALSLGLATQSTASAVPTYAKWKVFATTIAKALANTKVVASMLLVGSIPTSVLLDSRCTHSFVSPIFVYKASLGIVSLGQSFLVITPTVFFCSQLLYISNG